MGGLVGSTDGHRLVTGLDAGQQRGAPVLGRGGVPCQLGGGSQLGPILEHRRVRRVQPHPFAG